MTFFVDFALFFRTIDGLFWYGTVSYASIRYRTLGYATVRYGSLEISDKYGLPTVLKDLLDLARPCKILLDPTIC